MSLLDDLLAAQARLKDEDLDRVERAGSEAAAFTRFWEDVPERFRQHPEILARGRSS